MGKIEEYLEGINLGDYDLGGIELTDMDVLCISQRMKQFPNKSLEQVVDEYLFEIRQILDEGLS